jgi:hypothetical protein
MSYGCDCCVLECDEDDDEEEEEEEDGNDDDDDEKEEEGASQVDDGEREDGVYLCTNASMVCLSSSSGDRAGSGGAGAAGECALLVLPP